MRRQRLECRFARTGKPTAATVETTRFQRLTEAAYRQLTAGGRALEADRHGTKLIALGDGRYLKLFRRKRLLSSALMRPYSWRFQRNARRLAALGIPTVAPEALLRIPHLRRTAVLYRPLAGRTLRELLDAEPGSERWIAEFGRFLGQLHRQGVYFRSLHFGNLVVGDGGVFGLIDVADLEFRAAPLPPSLVVRNLRHLLRYPQDGDRVRAAHAAFRTGYDQTGQTLPASAASLLASP
jgi:tRNA A-37 threonylcarbamoyl transferase component Bud32